MRLKSAVWVAAYVRARASQAIPAYIARRGEDSAGAIIIRVDRLDGTVVLLLPAPQALVMDGDGERYWTAMNGGAPVSEADARQRIARETDFDPDLWVIDVEDREGRDFLAGRLVGE